jgi:hypothetical protein
VLAARLADGLLVLITHATSWDRHLPQELPYRLTRPQEPAVHVTLHGLSHVAEASVAREDREAGMVGLDHVSGRRWTSSERWECFLERERGIRVIQDVRRGEMVRTEMALTRTERDLCVFRVPALAGTSGKPADQTHPENAPRVTAA